MKNNKYDIDGAHSLANKVYQNSPNKLAKAKEVNDACAKERKLYCVRLTIYIYTF